MRLQVSGHTPPGAAVAAVSSQLGLLVVWMFVGQLPVWLVTLPFQGPLAGAAIAVSQVILGAAGWSRMRRVGLTLDADGVTIQNVFRGHRLARPATREIVLRRFLGGSPAHLEVPPDIPRALTVFGVGIPGVAFVGEDGRVSPIASITFFVGPETRALVEESLVEWSSTVEAPIRFRRPNEGWMFGASWDMRRAPPGSRA